MRERGAAPRAGGGASEGRRFETALKALLFDKIARLHEETVEKGLPVGVDVKRRADVAYTAYAALGGNGVGRHLYEELIEAHASTGPGTVLG